MARFYSTIQGGRGEATRLGHATSGVRAAAQSFTGSVITWMFVGDDGEDWCTINVRPGSESYPGGKLLFRGPVRQLLEQSARKTMLEHLVADVLVDG
jgi:hypothetical protein